MQNQSKNAITFDTQLETALCVSQVTNGFGVERGGSKKAVSVEHSQASSNLSSTLERRGEGLSKHLARA